MTSAEVERFFRGLSQRFSEPVGILLFGGGAAIVQTRSRATQDLDLEVQAPARTRERAAVLQRLLIAIQETQDAMQLKVQAGEDIHRWSMINWADYRDHQRVWKRFGSITVYLLEPEYFALTKLSRSSEIDLLDITRVFRARGGSWQRLARVCGKALRESPVSTAQFGFRLHVEHFFRQVGPVIWGSRFSATAAIALFERNYRRKAASR